MNINTIETLYKLLKVERYRTNPQVNIKKVIFDNSKEAYRLVFPRMNSGENYVVENISRQSYFIFKLCEKGCSIETIVETFMCMKNSPSSAAVIIFVVRTIRDFQKKGIIYYETDI